jgi:hypothetical protein
VQGDVSASIKTYLTATCQQIALSGPSSYLFPLGPTNITNVVTNAYNVTTQQTVTIRVRDTTAPVVTASAPLDVVLTVLGLTVNYAGKVGPGTWVGIAAAALKQTSGQPSAKSLFLGGWGELTSLGRV